MISPRLRRWLMIAGLVNFGALFSTSASVNKELLDRGDVHLWRTLFDEFTGYNTILILLPATLALMARFPIRKTNWARTVPIHLGGSLVFAVAHTTLMTLVRTPLYPVFGLGHYEVGEPLVRFGLEYHKQFLGYCLTYGIVAFVTYYRSTREEYERAAQLRLQTEHLKAELADARLAALERQIQPHFLFNTLNTISSVMYEDLDTADRMISNLSALLRMSLERAEDPKIPLREELAITELYLDIMSARFTDRLEVDFDVDAAARPCLVPTLVLQPLVENAIKHNPPRADRPARVRVSAHVAADGDLVVAVEDNGPGLGAEGISMARGVGLRNTQSRLQTLYPGRTLEFVPSALGGLRVQLNLPSETP